MSTYQAFIVCGLLLFSGSTAFGYADKLQCERRDISRIAILGLSVNETPIEVPLAKKTLINSTMRNHVFALEVADVTPGSVAQQGGLQPGDLIYKVRALYFEKRNAKQQFNNILGHSTEKLTMHYFKKSGASHHIVFTRPRSACELSQLIYKKATHLYRSIELHHRSIPIRPLSISYLTDSMPSPEERAKQLPSPPNCEHGQDKACLNLTEAIESLSGKIPKLSSALDAARAIANRDTSALKEEMQEVYKKGLDVLEVIKQDRWDDPAGSLERVNLIEQQWKNHRSNMLKWEEELEAVAKEYQALSEAWEKDLKEIEAKFVDLQYHNQAIAKQQMQQKREQEQEAANQALTERRPEKEQTAFSKLVARHHLTLTSPSQDLTIGMFVGGKEVVGRPAYFQDMQYYGPSRTTPGAVVLWTAYPPGFGLPGVYLAILKTENLQPQHRYSCVVNIVDTFTAPTTFFRRLTQFYYARNGFTLTPGVFWMMPFKEQEYDIPVVQEIECLPGHPKATEGSIFYEEIVMP
ncbi:MAG: hypothetical protein WD425_09525 [Nitrospirales bacterium]